ncbi:MAG: hypothetical protein ABJQ29_05930 [Luteolibacter sp.]
MRFLSISILSLVLSIGVSAEVPEVFKGLFEEGKAVRASIGFVVPPPEIEKFIGKVETAAKKNPQWFREFTEAAEPGTPLPYHENLGLTKEEYDEYLALWAKRDFKSSAEVVLLLRKSFGDTWTVTATGDASVISTLRYDPKDDSFRSPNGLLKRLEDINAEPLSILGDWSGKEWRFEEETGLGKTKENIAIGKYDDKPFGLIVYRVQELSSEGSRLMDKSLCLRFALGKAGQIQAPAAP